MAAGKEEEEDHRRDRAAAMMIDSAEDATTADRGNINMGSTAKTPRRINTNPQSSSPPRKKRDEGYDHNNEDEYANDDENDDDDVNNDALLTTPLCILSTLLQHSHSYKQSTLHLFRTCHAAHLHTIDRKKKALEALRLAQAEYEHATTAEEFAMQELKLAKGNKDDASTKYNSVRLDVNRLATSYKGLRVELVNLQSNSNWNGRRGEIVNMVTDGSDSGRWKVKLDTDWRGKEPDGNYSPFETNGSGGNTMLSQDKHHVVARAENLQLIESHNHGGLPSFLGSTLIRQEVGGNVDDAAVKSSRSSSLSPSLPGDNDEESKKKKKNHPLDPVEELPESESHVVTPDKRGGRMRIYSDHQPLPTQQHGANNDWKRNALGSYYSPPGIGPDNSYIHHHPKGIRRPIPQQWHQSPLQQQQQRIHHSQQRHRPQQQQNRQTPTARMAGTRVSPRSPISTQQRMYDRNQVQVSASFTEMATPMAFEAPSFQLIETTESFRQHHSDGPDGSFFEEVSQHEDTDHRSRDQSSHGPPPDNNSTSTVVVLPLNDEEGEGNKGGRPTCFAVQNADISHVNGVYVLNEDESDSDASDAPPLYFRDGDPILLSDGRYYDMCIMRSACPESPDHVIWFLARVNVDPDCLDVNFSDCYYYCRLLTSDGIHTPPMKGWQVSGMQPDASSEKSGYRTEKDDRRQLQSQQQQLPGDKGNQESNGLGASPRVAEADYV